MRPALRPIGARRRSAAAPATVTGKVPQGHWCEPGRLEDRRGLRKERPEIRKPGDLPVRHVTADGGFRDRLGAGANGWAIAHVLRRPLPHKEGTARVSVTIHVCTTCKMGRPTPEGATAPGARLFAALRAAGAPAGVRIAPVECLSACDHGCNIALTGPGRWSYVYRGLDPEAHVADILAGAAAYAATSDGIVPWRERPVIFRKQSLARIPPMES